ncbi:hypothetical protein GCM10022251_80640 [Phytohabitans flavus]|uniref:Uncharacterized protein n=1 Tax=Phytohabitans flavus TaxID=1076124 RepID=A0A6F8XYA6_9ACTN|nr:hypothetical protein Pflav_052360 [Phytohabitans flavus]
MWLRKLREHASPNGIERDLRGGGVLDHCDVLHTFTFSPTSPLVKKKNIVGDLSYRDVRGGPDRCSRGLTLRDTQSKPA